MDRIVVVETPLPNSTRLALAMKNPFSPLFAKSKSDQSWEKARWSILEDFLRRPTTEDFSRDTIYAWPLADLKKVLKWVRMLTRISGVKHSTFTTDAAKIFATRSTPIWLLRPELLFDEE